jgi:hypothetical protein
MSLRDAVDKTQHAITMLHQALDQPSNLTTSQYEPKRGRLYVHAKGAQDGLVRNINVALFSLRKALALVAHISSLAEAMQIFMTELAKSEDISSLRVETNENGAIKIMAGDRELNLKKLDKLSKPAIQFRDALVDLLENVETAATSLPELVEQSDAFAIEAQEFPSKVPDAASNAGLGYTEIPKAAMSTGSNVKQLSNGPRIANATASMVQYAGRELAQGLRKPLGA